MLKDKARLELSMTNYPFLESFGTKSDNLKILKFQTVILLWQQP